MNRIPVLVAGPMIASLMSELEQEYEVYKLWEQSSPDAFLKANGDRIQALVTSYVYGANPQLLETLPNLKIIASYGVGVDRIDLMSVKSRGILLANTPDIQEPVADTAIALLLAVTRKVIDADRFVRSGQWQQQAFPLGVGLTGKTCGIVGLGRIGRAIAKRAEAFGLKVAYYGPHQKTDVTYAYYDSLESLAQVSDFLILALPGGEQTYHVVNETILKALGPTGFLVNVARGSVVDEAALIRCLQAGDIAGAGLDVFEQEPLIDSPLLQLENVVLLPHIASATVETRVVMGEVVLANLRTYFANQSILNPVAVS